MAKERGGDDSLVGAAEIATRIGVSSERVRQLAKADQLPQPVGRLGRRQLVWRWSDVEKWAWRTGRLGDDPSGSVSDASFAAAALRSPRDPLRLVVDDLMPWGPRQSGPCHVRVWAPLADASTPPVVILGAVEDSVGPSVTNDIENVAMTAAARYLDHNWHQARFIEYSMSIDSPAGEFNQVDFTYEARPRQRRDNLSTTEAALRRKLGGALVDPQWTEISRSEVDAITGDTPQVWVSGTYTAALLAATPDRAARTHQVVWDPGRATEYAQVAAVLHSGAGVIAGLTRPLPVDDAELGYAITARMALDAFDDARADVLAQPSDAAITLVTPTLPDQSALFTAAQDADRLDHAEVWALLSRLRRLVLHGAFDEGSALADYQQSLVPGVYGGYVLLPWYDAGIAEVQPERWGIGGPIALPADLLDAEPAHRLTGDAQLAALLDALAQFLEEEWPDYYVHAQPAWLPSTTLPSTGPLTAEYLRSVQWRPLDSVDPAALQRMEAVIADIDQAGHDRDGRLVAKNRSREFCCEWPNGPIGDVAGLDTATIRADTPVEGGPTAVYIEYADGRLAPLPSAAEEAFGNSYTWGYPGGGPANLAAAVTQLLAQAHPGLDVGDIEREVRRRVAQRRTPSWHVGRFFESETADDRPPSRRRSRRPR